MEWEKGIDFLSEVIKQVLKENTDIYFVLIGSGPCKIKIKKQFKNEKNVRFEGYVPHEKINEYFKAADLLILTSPIEGLPNVVLESMAVGIPVITRPSSPDIKMLISNICDTPWDFAYMIKNKTYVTDKLPPEYTWENLKQRYISFFKDLQGGR
jgi:glycosyltransferase involved in cell wall biosynthesis